MSQAASKNFDDTDIYKNFGLGSLGIYHTPSEFVSLMSRIQTSFPELVKQVTVGKTYLGKSIPGYALSMGMNSTNWNTIALSKPALFINAAHHARELSTIAMTEYTMLRILFDFVKNDALTLDLLTYTTILIVPVINVDGYLAINDFYTANKNFTYIRKNRHSYAT